MCKTLNPKTTGSFIKPAGVLFLGFQIKNQNQQFVGFDEFFQKT
jgi:hypothetical protein